MSEEIARCKYHNRFRRFDGSALSDVRADFSDADSMFKEPPIWGLSQRVRRHNLNDGDVITIGRHDLIYIDERSSMRSGRLWLGRGAAAAGH